MCSPLVLTGSCELNPTPSLATQRGGVSRFQSRPQPLPRRQQLPGVGRCDTLAPPLAPAHHVNTRSLCEHLRRPPSIVRAIIVRATIILVVPPGTGTDNMPSD